jgi:hypothetical protein
MGNTFKIRNNIYGRALGTRINVSFKTLFTNYSMLKSKSGDLLPR